MSDGPLPDDRLAVCIGPHRASPQQRASVPGSWSYRSADPQVEIFMEISGTDRLADSVVYGEVFSIAPQRLPAPPAWRDVGFGPHVLTVELAVPLGRESEWNEWYHEEHMPVVIELMPSVQRARRLKPLFPQDAPYLVTYEFESLSALEGWHTSAQVTGKRSEYFERWGVRNRRSAFVAA